MKVFISWSGDISHKVALVLDSWLPSVIQSIDPYVSSKDIDKGARWSMEISKELDESSFGILCITKDNIGAKWLNFEAGALSKSVDQIQRVSPFLFGVERADIEGPISQFQSTTFDKNDVKLLVQSLNKAAGESSLEEARVDDIFDVWWPKLEEKLQDIQIPEPRAEPDPQEAGLSSDVLEEILELLRRQHRLLSSPEEFIPPDYLSKALNSLDRPIPLGAFRDLEIAWKELNLLVSSLDSSLDLDEEELISASSVRELEKKFRRPVEYILRRTRRLRPLRKSLD